MHTKWTARRLAADAMFAAMVTVLGQDSFAQSVRENAADIGLDAGHELLHGKSEAKRS